MKRMVYTISHAVESQRSQLALFFKASQYVTLSHWAKNVWLRILKISLFGEISENVAVDIVGHEMIGPCTIAIVHDNDNTWLVIADTVGISKIDLRALSTFQLERLGGILNGRIFPADMFPNNKVQVRHELLQEEIGAMDNGSPSFYLAGL